MKSITTSASCVYVVRRYYRNDTSCILHQDMGLASRMISSTPSASPVANLVRSSISASRSSEAVVSLTGAVVEVMVVPGPCLISLLMPRDPEQSG